MQYVENNEPKWRYSCVFYDKPKKQWHVRVTHSKRVGSCSCGPHAAVVANAAIEYWHLDKPKNLTEAGLEDQVNPVSGCVLVLCRLGELRLARCCTTAFQCDWLA